MRWILIVALAAPLAASGQTIIERGEDLSYRQVMDGPIGAQIIRTLNQLNEAYDAAKEAEEIQSTDTVAQWCAKLFTGTPSCTSSGDAEYDVTNFADQAHTQLVKIYECADNQTCNANDRLPKLRRAANEIYGALRRDADPQIVEKWRIAITRLADAARGVNDEWVRRLRKVNAQSTQMMGVKTAQQLCNTQWFVGSADCGTDDADRLRSEDLKTALEALQDMYDCANNVACGVGDRLDALEKYVRIR